MRKLALTVFVVLAGGLLMAFDIAETKAGGRVQTPPTILTQGLPEHGVLAVGPTEPTFDSLVSVHAQKLSGVDVGELKRSSVLVLNQSGRGIAALDIRWDLRQPNGRIITQHWAHKGPLEVVADSGGPRLGETLSANASRLFSLLGPVIPNRGGFLLGGGNPATSTERFLSESVSQTISIDGVLFVDGTFVGPDTRDFLGTLKVEIEACREAIAEIAQGLGGDAEALKRVEFLANGKAQSYREQIKQAMLRMILTNRERLGDQKVLEEANAFLKKPQIALRRL